MPSRIVYLNGHFLPLEEAHVSVMDRGFLFGDGVYEVIPIFCGKLFRPQAHLQRLKASLAAIRLDCVWKEAAYIDLFEKLLQHNPEQGENRSVYIQITRGAGENREHVFPKKEVTPTIFVQCTPFEPVSFETYMQGAKAITLPDIRWANCFIKAITLLPNLLLAQQALEEDAKEVILIREGMAVEGVASNLCLIKNNRLITPPVDGSILSGVTRSLILEIAAQQQIPCIEQKIPVAMLQEADEIWMTGSLKEILPITQIDEMQVGNGKVGPVWQVFFRCYQEIKLE
jgi:D-alanine transaminase